MEGYTSYTMPFLRIGIYEVDSEFEILDVYDFRRFEILPDKLFLPIFPHLLSD